MEITVTLKVEDYVYQFYQIGAEVLNRTPEDMMEEALFMYAGIAAQELTKNREKTKDSYLM